MCFFKKKKEKVVVTNNKFKVHDKVNFKHRDDVSPGYIYDVYYDENKNIICDIQIGGECPAIMKGIKEEDIFYR